MNKTAVTAADAAKAMRDLGVEAGDVVLVHSSMKSMGYVEGGPAAVIEGIESVLGRTGTLVMPTLSQVDFKNSYKTWYMDKPSDVGYLTEYFRKQPYVYRSNQETHSVAARGALAYELTKEHKAYGPHLCPFGNFAFADSSPWAKMEALDAKIVFIGVDMTKNTIKHLVEGRFTERLLSGVREEETREELLARVRLFERRETPGMVWPYFSGNVMQEALEAEGLIRHARCGGAEVLCVGAGAFCKRALSLLEAEPERFIEDEAAREWIEACRRAG